MNKSETAEAILVMQDWIDGEDIQCKPRTFAETNWGNDKPMWNWSGYIYRTKPSPREFWVKIPDVWKTGDQLHVLKGSDPMIVGNRGNWIHVREVLE